MEASALQAPASLPHTRVALGTPLLRFRSDEQLVALFRAGHEEAFRVIHERYHRRLFAYTRQMLPGRQDAEDALQDVFIRAYSGLRASERELALRAWLFRVAHNRCIDELRRPAPPPPEVLQLVRGATHDPLAEVDLRDSLRRLIEDIRRLPGQQRSALLMRELGGMSYADLAVSLGVSVGAVKSLLVRARIGLAQATAARDTACGVIREHLVYAHDRGLRPDANARRHMRDCAACKSFRRELRGVSRQLAAVAPGIGPLGVLAKLLGVSSGGGAGGGAALLSGGGATASAGGLAVGVNHVAGLIVAAVATAGGAVEIQHTIIAPAHRPAHTHHLGARAGRSIPSPVHPVASSAARIQVIARAVEVSVSAAPSAAPPASTATTPAKPKHRAGRRSDMAPAVTRLDSSSSSTTRTSAPSSTTPGQTGVPSTAGSTACSGAPSTGSANGSASSGPTVPVTSSAASGPTTSGGACAPTGAGSTTASNSSATASGTTSSGGTGSPSGTSGGSSTSSAAAPASDSGAPGSGAAASGG